MNKKETPRILTAKYLLVIPMLAVAFLVVQISGLQAGKIYDINSIDENPVFTNVAVFPAIENIENHISTKPTIKKIEKPVVSAPDSNVNIQSPDSGKQESMSSFPIIIPMPKFPSIEPLYVVDGKKINKETFNMIDPHTIESVSVLKDSTATKYYGKQAINGVIIITTKAGANSSILQQSVTKTIQVSGTVTAAKDGKALPGVAVVVKGGSIGTVTDMNGNFSLDTPADATLTFAFIGMTSQEIVVVRNLKQIDVVLESETQPQGKADEILTRVRNIQQGKDVPVLYVVDGEEISSIKELSPYNIESFTVLKDEAAIEKYGEKGKNGVVIITTKK